MDRWSDSWRERRPRRGRIIISDLQRQVMETGRAPEPPSFLNDPTDDEESMMDRTDEQNLEEHRKQREAAGRARVAEFEALGQNPWVWPQPLPPIPVRFAAPRDESSDSEMSQMEEEEDKENDAAAPVAVEKEADETTPIAANQRDTGLASASISSRTTPAAAAASIPQTPPSRPGTARRPSEFRRPEVPERKQPPRHSTPKAATRASFGSAFSNISIIANSSMGSDRGGSAAAAARATVTPTAVSARMVLEESGNAATSSNTAPTAAEGTFVIGREDEVAAAAAAAGGSDTFVVEDRELSDQLLLEPVNVQLPQQPVEVAVAGVSMSRQERHSASRRDATMGSVGEEEEEERDGEGEEVIAVAGISVRRQSVPGDVTMQSVGAESMEDEEMASVGPTPPRPRPVSRVEERRAVGKKRPSLEHPVTAASSPMAVQLAGRAGGGVREAMVRPKLSIQPRVPAPPKRKVSTDSIQFEDISAHSGMLDSSESFADATTPQRTPRTTRLLRQSLAARDQRQSQSGQQRLALLEESALEEGEEEEEVEGERRDAPASQIVSQQVGATTTPVLRSQQQQARLSLRLQASVDRLSQPRHGPRSDTDSGGSSCCARAHSPGRTFANCGRPTAAAAAVRQHAPSPAPIVAARRQTTMMRGGGGRMGYTPSQRIDTTMMEDGGGAAKSGMAPRIKRNPIRATGRRMVLNMSGEEEREDVESERRVSMRDSGATLLQQPVRDGTMMTMPSSLSLFSHDEHTRSDLPEEGGEGEREEEEETVNGLEGMDDDSIGGGHSMGGGMGEEIEEEEVFARPVAPAASAAAAADPTTPRGRRSVAARSEMEALSSRASMISIDEDVASSSSAAPAAAARPALPVTPKTPFRRAIASNDDLFSTETPGLDRRSFMNTTEEDQWADDADSMLWRGRIPTASDENEASFRDSSQLDDSQNESQGEEEEEERPVREKVLAPRKLIAPTGTPGMRRSTRTRMKPVRAWLGEKAEYEYSPTTGEARLVGVNEVVIKDKLFVKTGTADIVKAVEKKKQTERQRRLAKQKNKNRKREEEEESDE